MNSFENKNNLQELEIGIIFTVLSLNLSVLAAVASVLWLVYYMSAQTAFLEVFLRTNSLH